jgi:hypothetical protein
MEKKCRRYKRQLIGSCKRLSVSLVDLRSLSAFPGDAIDGRKGVVFEMRDRQQTGAVACRLMCGMVDAPVRTKARSSATDPGVFRSSLLVQSSRRA